MIKKLCILLALITAMLPASAQQAVGSWTFYPSFSTVSKIIESKERVYFLSSGSLFYFDKDTEERGQLNASNGLNDVSISDIFYNPVANYLLVCYSTGNMDKIHDNGKIVNLPDIANAIMTTTPSVKDVAFGKDCFYVLTNFGLVNYDDNSNEVRATAYTTDIQSVMVIGDHVVANIENQLRFAPTSERVTNIDKLKVYDSYTNAIAKPKMLGTTSDTGYFADGVASGYSVWRMTINFDTQAFTFGKITDPATARPVTGITDMRGNSDGSASFYTADAIYRVAADGTTTRIGIPASLKGQLASADAGASSVWTANSSGVAEFDLTGPEPVVLHDRFTGSELTLADIRHLSIGNDNSITASHRAIDQLISHSVLSQPARVVIIENGKIKDVTPQSACPWGNLSIQRTLKIPGSDDSYYIATWGQGLCRIDNGQWTARYNYPWTNQNGPAQLQYVADIDFDGKGNLWIVHSNTGLYCVSAESIAKDPATFTVADVQKIVPGYNGATHQERSSRVFAGKKSNIVVMAKCYWTPTLTFVDTKGTSSVTDDVWQTVETVYDQDNNAPECVWSSFAEDNDGNIWGGGDGVVFNFGKPQVEKLGSSEKFTRIKIPRNDGTNLADYLADGAQVYDMAFDAANNKWLATSSGAIQVNAANDRILEQFTKDNSPLPYTRVTAVACDPNTSSVWFGVENGLMEYSSTTSPGNDDYSEVYAYPNPVRPEYSGWITVKGLMNDSLVKIADAAGNVVAQGRSNGGMFVWDGANTAGERVPSGVYYVFASQNATGSSSGAVTKILIVN